MTLGLIAGVGGPSQATLDRHLAAARRASVTYEHIGSTLAPAGRARRRRSIHLGSGPEAFARGTAALRAWAPHHGIGADIHPAGTPLAVDETVLVVLRAGRAWAIAPNRIVAVVDDHHRFGFAYGSLPGHPERGEESFTIEQDDRTGVRAVITVDSTPGTPLTRGLRPFTRAAQHLAVTRYLQAIAKAGM